MDATSRHPNKITSEVRGGITSRGVRLVVPAYGQNSSKVHFDCTEGLDL